MRRGKNLKFCGGKRGHKKQKIKEIMWSTNVDVDGHQNTWREEVVLLLACNFKSVELFTVELKKTNLRGCHFHICDGIRTEAQLKNQLQNAIDRFPEGRYFKAIVFLGGHGCEAHKLHIVLNEEGKPLVKVDISNIVLSAFKVTKHCHFPVCYLGRYFMEFFTRNWTNFANLACQTKCDDFTLSGYNNWILTGTKVDGHSRVADYIKNGCPLLTWRIRDLHLKDFTKVSFGEISNFHQSAGHNPFEDREFLERAGLQCATNVNATLILKYLWSQSIRDWDESQHHTLNQEQFLLPETQKDRQAATPGSGNGMLADVVHGFMTKDYALTLSEADAEDYRDEIVKINEMHDPPVASSMQWYDFIYTMCRVGGLKLESSTWGRLHGSISVFVKWKKRTKRINDNFEVTRSPHNDAVNKLAIAWCRRHVITKGKDVMLLVNIIQEFSEDGDDCVNNVESHVAELMFSLKNKKKRATDQRVVISYSDTSMTSVEYERDRNKKIVQVEAATYVKDIVAEHVAVANDTHHSIETDFIFESSFRLQPDGFTYCYPAKLLVSLLDVPEKTMRAICDIFWLHKDNKTARNNGTAWSENQSTRITLLRLFMRHMTSIPCLIEFFNKFQVLKTEFINDYEITDGNDPSSFGVCNICCQIDTAKEIMLCEYDESCPCAVHVKCQRRYVQSKLGFSINNTDPMAHKWYCPEHTTKKRPAEQRDDGYDKQKRKKKVVDEAIERVS